jgi:hypothetical protein
MEATHSQQDSSTNLGNSLSHHMQMTCEPFIIDIHCGESSWLAHKSFNMLGITLALPSNA